LGYLAMKELFAEPVRSPCRYILVLSKIYSILWCDMINKAFFVVTALLEHQASWEASGIFLL